jgi:hypothetical protein
MADIQPEHGLIPIKDSAYVHFLFLAHSLVDAIFYREYIISQGVYA